MVAVGIPQPILANEFAFMDSVLGTTKLSTLEDIELGHTAADRYAMHRPRLFRQPKAMQLNQSAGDLKIHSRQRSWSEGKSDKTVAHSVGRRLRAVPIRLAAKIDGYELTLGAMPRTDQIGSRLGNVGASACRR